MNFYQIDKKLINITNIENIHKAYALENEKKIIGYGITTNNVNNKIEIYIKEEYRSNGYGKILFGKMLEELKKENYKEIKLVYSRDNYRIRNIIEYYGGKQLYTNEKEESYILPIK